MPPSVRAEIAWCHFAMFLWYLSCSPVDGLPDILDAALWHAEAVNL